MNHFIWVTQMWFPIGIKAAAQPVCQALMCPLHFPLQQSLCRILQIESTQISSTMACGTGTLLPLLAPECFSVPGFSTLFSWAKPNLSQVTFLSGTLFGAVSITAHFGGQNCLFSTDRAGSLAQSGTNLLQLPFKLLQQLMRAGTSQALKYLSRVNAVKVII